MSSYMVSVLVAFTSFPVISSLTITPMLPFVLFSSIHQSRLKQWVKREELLNWCHSYSWLAARWWGREGQAGQHIRQDTPVLYSFKAEMLTEKESPNDSIMWRSDFLIAAITARTQPNWGRILFSFLQQVYRMNLISWGNTLLIWVGSERISCGNWQILPSGELSFYIKQSCSVSKLKKFIKITEQNCKWRSGSFLLQLGFLRKKRLLQPHSLYVSA